MRTGPYKAFIREVKWIEISREEAVLLVKKYYDELEGISVHYLRDSTLERLLNGAMEFNNNEVNYFKIGGEQ